MLVFQCLDFHKHNCKIEAIFYEVVSCIKLCENYREMAVVKLEGGTLCNFVNLQCVGVSGLVNDLLQLASPSFLLLLL